MPTEKKDEDLPKEGTRAEMRADYIPDFISGRQVRITPEEIEAVQVFSRRLVEEFGYPKKNIITRPQHRVRQSPSGGRKQGYPLDIAVFKNESKLETDLKAAQRREPWVSIQDLMDEDLLLVGTGVEVGKMAYGTGGIPFIRTTDLIDWVIRRDVRQGISEAVYDKYKNKADVQSSDVLLIRDGSYLVGSSALATADDLPALFCGGIFRLRSMDSEKLSPFALLALLDLPLVRRQLRARQFTRDVIDTLGRRFLEVRIPALNSESATLLAAKVSDIMDRLSSTKKEIGAIIDAIEPPNPPQTAGRPGWSMR
jgi:hypothetical protein